MSHHFIGTMFPISEITVYKRINGTIEMEKHFAYLRAILKLKDAYSLKGKLWPT